jgi:hypothetical protein
MPYDNVPTDNAPALPPTWEFTVDLSRATIDDLDLFDASTQTSNKEMLDYLDRIIKDVQRNGESLGPGVRGKGVPYLRLKSIFEAVGAAMKEANNPGN